MIYCNITILYFIHEIITDSVVLYEMQKFDWLTLKPSGILCLHNIALCSETRIHSSGAPWLQPSWTRDNKYNHKMAKTFFFLTQLLKPITSRTSSPACDFISCVRTSALKPAKLQLVFFRESPDIFSMNIYSYSKSQWIYL